MGGGTPLFPGPLALPIASIGPSLIPRAIASMPIPFLGTAFKDSFLGFVPDGTSRLWTLLSGNGGGAGSCLLSPGIEGKLSAVM